MASQGFSNTNVGDKPADPYKEKNLDRHASVAEKIEDLAQFETSTKFGMMTTRDSQTGNLVSRAMALAAQETGGLDLLFHTNTESGKTDELAADPHINVSFSNSSGEWASITGLASIETDRDLIKKHYSAHLKAWMGDLGDGKHDGSADDPRLGIIRVKTTLATYSVTSKSTVGMAAEVAKGALTGKPAAVNKLREISEEDVRGWRAVN